MSRLLCLGEPLIEFNQRDDGSYVKAIGGDVSNCAIAAARSGLPTGMATLMAEDTFAAEIEALWDREGIDRSQTRKTASGPTGIYFVSHGADGHSFSYYRHGSASSLADAGYGASIDMAGVEILHVSGISQAISDSASEAVLAAIENAKRSGARISYDTNLRLQLWPIEAASKTIHTAMALADIALPGLEDAEQLTGLGDPDAIADFYLGLGPEIVALTLGSDGVLVATAERREIIPSIRVRPVDATAAGDTFDGCFLAELLNGKSPFEAAHYANAAGACAVQIRGAVPSIPTRAKVLAFLAENAAGS